MSRREYGSKPWTGDISVTYNEFQAENDSFVMNGTVVSELANEDASPFVNVTGCSFGSEGNRLAIRSVGTLNPPENAGFLEFDLDRVPDYIVIDHPRFDDYEAIAPLVLAWSEEQGHYRPTQVDDLPFDYGTDDTSNRCWSETHE